MRISDTVLGKRILRGPGSGMEKLLRVLEAGRRDSSERNPWLDKLMLGIERHRGNCYDQGLSKVTKMSVKSDGSKYGLTRVKCRMVVKNDTSMDARSRQQIVTG